MSALGQLGVTQLLVVTDPRARRKANFSRAEIDALVSGYKTYRPLIERRCTGGSKDRNQAWDLITKSLFAVSGVRRTAAEVRKKWADLKSLSKKGTEEPSDNLNSNADVKSLPAPQERCPVITNEVPCTSRSTQTTEPSSPSERQLFEVSGSPDMKKMRVGGGDEETSELLKTQKEILHVLKRLAKAQERLVQLKAWKHGVKLTEHGISYEHQSAEHSRKNGLQGATPASTS
ncbi:uncharacterized protein LOC142575469 isoform X6 [Dermacentor variabilis]|uniref:uncharacterized protein LOC142575469 isoform X6 n=1 Tax=Dermacentor variabilis TaxID=34621 RepID=UPI003F5B4DE3